ncbi:MAG: hypothetical protein P8189_10215 [Anaerolineae bacterium]
MTLDELKQLDDPGSLGSDHLRAIWYDLHGDWDTAHTIVQNLSDLYIWNSKYWYRRCGRPYPGDLGFEEEMALILSELS